MWIGSIRLRVKTASAPSFAGTDSLVTATIVRDGVDLLSLKLDYPSENDLEPGAIRNYNYLGPSKMGWKNDKTPPLPNGIGQNPMPYPSYGIEFSNGLDSHLKIRLRIHGSDLWIKDQVDLYIREVRLKATSFDTLAWQEDSDWTFVGSWPMNYAMSTDPSEGVKAKMLVLS